MYMLNYLMRTAQWLFGCLVYVHAKFSFENITVVIWLFSLCTCQVLLWEQCSGYLVVYVHAKFSSENNTLVIWLFSLCTCQALIWEQYSGYLVVYVHAKFSSENDTVVIWLFMYMPSSPLRTMQWLFGCLCTCQVLLWEQYSGYLVVYEHAKFSSENNTLVIWLFMYMPSSPLRTIQWFFGCLVYVHAKFSS